MTVPTRYNPIATLHTSSHVPVFRIMPVAAVPRTPASTPAVFDMPSRTPEYLGAISCASQGLFPQECHRGVVYVLFWYNIQRTSNVARRHLYRQAHRQRRLGCTHCHAITTAGEALTTPFVAYHRDISVSGHTGMAVDHFLHQNGCCRPFAQWCAQRLGCDHTARVLHSAYLVVRVEARL